MAPSKNQGVHYNATAISDSTPSGTRNDIIEANTTAVGLNNLANAAKEAGRLDEAIRLHMQAVAIKAKAYGDDSIQAAISFNALGGCLLLAGKLDEAEEALEQALKVRDYKEFGGLELGPRVDAADTRDTMGQLREAQGRWEDAAKVRRSGAEKGETMCGSLKVSCDEISLHTADLRTNSLLSSVLNLSL